MDRLVSHNPTQPRAHNKSSLCHIYLSGGALCQSTSCTMLLRAAISPQQPTQQERHCLMKTLLTLFIFSPRRVEIISSGLSSFPSFSSLLLRPLLPCPPHFLVGPSPARTSILSPAHNDDQILVSTELTILITIEPSRLQTWIELDSIHPTTRATEPTISGFNKKNRLSFQPLISLFYFIPDLDNINSLYNSPNPYSLFIWINLLLNCGFFTKNMT